MNNIPASLAGYYSAYLLWKAELKKYSPEKWPYPIRREEIIGLVNVWHGYLRIAGILN